MKKIFLFLALMVLSITALAETKTGVGVGFKDDIKVSVEVDGNKIVSIKVTSISDTPEMADPAIKKLTSDIIKKQSVKVDNVAGATYTSQGFKEAVENALSK